MQERLRRLSLVNEAGRAMSAILDLDQLLERILSLADEVFDFANCAVLLLDPAANELFILEARGYEDEVVRSFRARPGQGITGAVLVEGRPIIVKDVTQDARYIPGVAGAHSEIAAPLVVDELIIGVLDAETSTPRSFSDEDLDFFTLFASQAATAIHNARLHYQVALHAKILEQRLEQLGTFLGACHMLGDGTPPGQVRASMLEAVRETSHADSCSLLLLRPDGRTLEELEGLGPRLFRSSSFTVDCSTGCIGKTIERAEPQMQPSLAVEPEPYTGFPRLGCELAAPLLRNGSPIGVLVAHRALGDPPGEMDLALFHGYATLLALGTGLVPGTGTGKGTKARTGAEARDAK